MKQIFNISADQSRNTAEETLLIRAGDHHFSFAITANNNEEPLQFTWYDIEEAGEHELQEIYLKHLELRESYEKIMVAFDYPESVLVPYSSYKQIGSRSILESVYGVNGTHVIIDEAVPAWQLYNIYAIPITMQDWMTRHFPTAHYLHNYSIGLKQINTTDFEGSMLLDFRINDFSLLLSKANKLLLTQTFSYTTPADVIYYLLKVTKEFLFTQDSIRLSISGMIEKDSNLYRELVQYFLFMRFREPSWETMPAPGEEYPIHFFTFFNDLASCES